MFLELTKDNEYEEKIYVKPDRITVIRERVDSIKKEDVVDGAIVHTAQREFFIKENPEDVIDKIKEVANTLYDNPEKLLENLKL